MGNIYQQGGGIFIEVHYLFFVLVIQHQVCRGRLLEDLDLSEGFSEVGPFVLFTIPTMKLSRVILQTSFFNDNSLLKSHDFTEVEKGCIVHWILYLIWPGQNLCIHTHKGRNIVKKHETLLECHRRDDRDELTVFTQ